MTPLLRALPGAALACALTAPALAHPDPDAFVQSVFVTAPQIVDCTLENGAAAHCYEFTVPYQPEGLEIGPFCPETLDDTGGLWDWDGENAGLYRLDRAFFEMLAAQGYRFHDADGTIAIADPATPGGPQVDHACLMATPDKSVLITLRLPVDPVMADAPTALGTVAKVGVGLDGVPIFADAPSVLDRGHLPALDVCGGHIDPGGWYHWHATATDIDTTLAAKGVEADCHLAQDPTAPFGYAFDGFPMLGSLESDGSEPETLDRCHGHVGETALGETYHYHASAAFPNLPPCLVGVVAQDNFSTTASNGIGAANAGGPEQGGGMPPGMDDAARALGVDPQALIEALGGPGQRPDLAAAAVRLGVTEDALRAALPPPPNR